MNNPLADCRIERRSKAMSFLDNARRALIGETDDVEYERGYDEEYDSYEEPPKRSLFSFLSRNKNDEYEDYEAEEQNAERRSSAKRAYSYSSQRASDRYSSNQQIKYESAASGVEVIVLYPTTFDDSAKLVREVKSGKITIFDVSGIATPEEARRIVDYICGAAEGMDCPFSRLCPSVFCIAPKGVTLTNRKSKY